MPHILSRAFVSAGLMSVGFYLCGASNIRADEDTKTKASVDSEKLSDTATHEEEAAADTEFKKHVIGTTAIVLETQSDLRFEARVDTGAACCSIHCEEWEIEDEADAMEKNVGKNIRVMISNNRGQAEWIESEISRCVTIRTSETTEVRYTVPMTLRWNDFEKDVIVNLDNRATMDYPLLLGRNFLADHFLVEVDSDSNPKKKTELAQSE